MHQLGDVGERENFDFDPTFLKNEIPSMNINKWAALAGTEIMEKFLSFKNGGSYWCYFKLKWCQIELQNFSTP